MFFILDLALCYMKPIYSSTIVSIEEHFENNNTWNFTTPLMITLDGVKIGHVHFYPKCVSFLTQIAG